MSELYGDESPGRNPSCDTCLDPCGLNGAGYVVLEVGGFRCIRCDKRIRRNALARGRRKAASARARHFDGIGDMWA